MIYIIWKQRIIEYYPSYIWLHNKMEMLGMVLFSASKPK